MMVLKNFVVVGRPRDQHLVSGIWGWLGCVAASSIKHQGWVVMGGEYLGGEGLGGEHLGGVGMGGILLINNFSKISD